MGLFKSKEEKELDSIIRRLEMNMSNNYKDNAQDNLKELEAGLNAIRSANSLKAVILKKYENILDSYKEKDAGIQPQGSETVLALNREIKMPLVRVDIKKGKSKEPVHGKRR